MKTRPPMRTTAGPVPERMCFSKVRTEIRVAFAASGFVSNSGLFMPATLLSTNRVGQAYSCEKLSNLQHFFEWLCALVFLIVRLCALLFILVNAKLSEVETSGQQVYIFCSVVCVANRARADCGVDCLVRAAKAHWALAQ